MGGEIGAYLLENLQSEADTDEEQRQHDASMIASMQCQSDTMLDVIEPGSTTQFGGCQAFNLPSDDAPAEGLAESNQPSSSRITGVETTRPTTTESALEAGPGITDAVSAWDRHCLLGRCQPRDLALQPELPAPVPYHLGIRKFMRDA